MCLIIDENLILCFKCKFLDNLLLWNIIIIKSYILFIGIDLVFSASLNYYFCYIISTRLFYWYILYFDVFTDVRKNTFRNRHYFICKGFLFIFTQVHTSNDSFSSLSVLFYTKIYNSPFSIQKTTDGSFNLLSFGWALIWSIIKWKSIVFVLNL